MFREKKRKLSYDSFFIVLKRRFRDSNPCLSSVVFRLLTVASCAKLKAGVEPACEDQNRERSTNELCRLLHFCTRIDACFGETGYASTKSFSLASYHFRWFLSVVRLL
jgi:hypothetical protein